MSPVGRWKDQRRSAPPLPSYITDFEMNPAWNRIWVRLIKQDRMHTLDLNLSGCRLKENHVAALVDTLRKMSSLRRLSLCLDDNGIQDMGAIHLLKILHTETARLVGPCLLPNMQGLAGFGIVTAKQSLSQRDTLPERGAGGCQFSQLAFPSPAPPPSGVLKQSSAAKHFQ